MEGVPYKRVIPNSSLGFLQKCHGKLSQHFEDFNPFDELLKSYKSPSKIDRPIEKIPETKNPFLQPVLTGSTQSDSLFARSVQKIKVEALTPLIPVATD